MSTDRFLDTLTFADFDQLIQGYIERSEPDAVSLDVFQALAAESNRSPMEVVLTGVIRDNQLELHIAQPTTLPLWVEGNAIQLLNLRLVIELPATATALGAMPIPG